MGKTEKKKAPRSKAELAQEKYDRASRVVSKLEERLAAAKTEVESLQSELTAAVRRRDYAAQDPDLPEQPEATVSGDDDPDRTADLSGDPT